MHLVTEKTDLLIKKTLIGCLLGYIQTVDGPLEGFLLECLPKFKKIGKKKQYALLESKFGEEIPFELKEGDKFELELPEFARSNENVRLIIEYCEETLYIEGKYNAPCHCCGEWEPEHRGFEAFDIPKSLCSQKMISIERPLFIMSKMGIQPMRSKTEKECHICPTCQVFTKAPSSKECKTCRRGIPLIKTPLFLVKHTGAFPVEIIMQYHFIMKLIKFLPTEMSAYMLYMLRMLM